MSEPRAPAAVCRVSELPEAGAFFTADIEGTPVLVARDARGTIRAFVNLCRHQGARLVHERHGVAKTFTCILHGWTYDAAGSMGGGVLARLAEDNPMLATLRATNALTPLPCELRHGFVWVMPKPRDAIDVASFLGALDAELAARGVEHWQLAERTESPVAPGEAPAPARVVLEGDTLSVETVCRRRAETDFGHHVEAEDVVSRVELRVSPASGAARDTSRSSP